LRVFCGFIGGLLLSVERNLLISLLKLTEKGAVEQETVKKEARLPASVVALLLRKLQNENLIYFQNGCIASDAASRLKIAAKALSTGADIEQLSRFCAGKNLKTWLPWRWN
jgi:hypothetical protein